MDTPPFFVCSCSWLRSAHCLVRAGRSGPCHGAVLPAGPTTPAAYFDVARYSLFFFLSLCLSISLLPSSRTLRSVGAGGGGGGGAGGQKKSSARPRPAPSVPCPSCCPSGIPSQEGGEGGGDPRPAPL